MRILTRSILREIFSSALLGTLLFTFVLFLQRAGRSFELLARSASGLDRIGYLILLIMPFPLTFALPVGALVVDYRARLVARAQELQAESMYDQTTERPSGLSVVPTLTDGERS